MEADPIGLVGGVNVFSYAGQNPVSYIDPEGDILVLIIAAVGVGGTIHLAIDGYGQFLVAKSEKKQWEAMQKLDKATGCEGENPETEEKRQDFINETGKVVPIAGEIIVRIIYP